MLPGTSCAYPVPRTTERYNNMNITHNEHSTVNANREAACYVCGADLCEGWFAQFSAAKATRFLCSAACALIFFDVARPPAHDHKARHEYQRMRGTIVRAARCAQEAQDRNSHLAMDARASRQPS